MEHSQATIDILNNPRYQGAIDSITGITNWVDVGFASIITFVAFFIMSVALLKNVLAGAYVAYPKFWDKVDMAHKETESQGWIQQMRTTFSSSGMEQINMGSVSKLLLRILPNIKTLTDFEEDTVSYKHYFLRAIPQMCLVIIIGAFIYNGFYRDVAAQVVDFGSEIFYRTVLEADPIAFYDKITSTAGRPDFATGGAISADNKFAYSVASSAYTTVIGTYTDINSAEQKSHLAQGLEAWVLEFLQEHTEYIGTEGWNGKVSTSLVLGPPDLTYINSGLSTDGLTYQVAYAKSIASLDLSTIKEVGKDWYVRVILNFSKVAIKEPDVSLLSDITLVLPPSALTKGEDTKIKIPAGAVKDGTGFDIGSNTNAKATVGKLTAVITEGTIIIKGWDTRKETIESVQCRIWYVVNGKKHAITSIVFDSSVGAGGHKMTSSKVADFKYNDGPVLKQKDSTEE